MKKKMKGKKLKLNQVTIARLGTELNQTEKNKVVGGLLYLDPTEGGGETCTCNYSCLVSCNTCHTYCDCITENPFDTNCR